MQLEINTGYPASVRKIKQIMWKNFYRRRNKNGMLLEELTFCCGYFKSVTEMYHFNILYCAITDTNINFMSTS